MNLISNKEALFNDLMIDIADIFNDTGDLAQVRTMARTASRLSIGIIRESQLNGNYSMLFMDYMSLGTCFAYSGHYKWAKNAYQKSLSLRNTPEMKSEIKGLCQWVDKLKYY